MAKAKPPQKKKGSTILPGLEKFVVKKDTQWFWENEKNEHYFDAAALPDAPVRQANAQGAQTFVLYTIFPSHAELTRAITALTQGRRKFLAPGAKTASINGVIVPDGSELTFLEIWEYVLLGVKPKKKPKVDPDEAQAPI